VKGKKIKNKDKIQRKSSVFSEPEIDQKIDSNQTVPNQINVEINALDKGRANAKKNFFQNLINEKKGLVTKEPELLAAPQLRVKRDSLTNSTEANSEKRRSFIKEEIRTDTKKFNSFLDKFENKEQRAEAKAQMIKITNQQKEFEKQKLQREQHKLEQEKLEQEKKAKAEQERVERELQVALEEEAQIQRIREEEETELRYRQLEEEEKEAQKTKSIRKKKRQKKEEISSNEPVAEGNAEIIHRHCWIQRCKK